MASGTFTLGKTRNSSSFIPSAHSRRRDHRFYTFMALAMAAGIFGGFFPTYYGKTFVHTPAIPLIVHLHGAAFTAWILFYVLQNLLAMYGGMKLHRNLGIVGATIAAAVLVLGIAVSVRQTMQGRSFPFPDIYVSLGLSLLQMISFGVMITVALLLRRDGETHKRLILMATQMFFFPAFGRLLHGINLFTLALALCFYFAGPIYDLITRRSMQTAYRWGVPVLVLTMPPFAMLASRAPVWRHVVDRLVG
jgi:hypothetical protein